MVWYDFVILAILAYTTWQGAQRGLVTQLAWIAALVLCFKFADKLAPAIEDQINVEQPLRHWIAMFVLYLGFSLGSFMAARILDSWLEKAKFKDFDRHLGALLGFVKGIVIAMVITFFALTLSDSLKSVVLASKSGQGACYVLDTVDPITPEYFSEYLAKYKKELADVHDEHLGDPSTTLHGLGTGPDEAEQGVGLKVKDLLGNLLGDRPTDPTTPEISQGPTIDQMLRKLTPEIRSQFGTRITDLWDSATPEQKQKLWNELDGAAFESQFGSVVSKFLGGFGSGGTSGQGSQLSLLEQIGDIYKNRELIVQRSREHFAGVPANVQQAVLEDWYADLRMIQPDPDTSTNIDSRLDDRIIRQLEKARVSISSLSFDLQQRLNLTRR